VLKKYSNLNEVLETVLISICIPKDGNSGLSINSKLKVNLFIFLSSFISSRGLFIINAAVLFKETKMQPDSIRESDISVSKGSSISSSV
jgi:hypothetical protein